jgi:hypothetical protein
MTTGDAQTMYGLVPTYGLRQLLEYALLFLLAICGVKNPFLFYRSLVQEHVTLSD